MFSFRTRIFGGMLAVALVVAGMAVFMGRSWFEQGQLEAARQRLLRETALAAALLEQLGPDPASLPRLARILKLPEERLTLTDAQGDVLADTAPGAQPVERLDNHADRPEIRAALAGEPGFALRPSGTLGTDMAYAAAPVVDGRVLRVAVPLDHLRQDIDNRAAFFTRLGLAALVLRGSDLCISVAHCAGRIAVCISPERCAARWIRWWPWWRLSLWATFSAGCGASQAGSSPPWPRPSTAWPKTLRNTSAPPRSRPPNWSACWKP